VAEEKEAEKPLHYARQRNVSQLKIKSHVNVTAKAGRQQRSGWQHV